MDVVAMLGGFGMLVFLWLLFRVPVGVVWAVRKLSFFQGVFVSMLLSPFAGLVIGVVMPNSREVEEAAIAAGQARRCPYCAELVRVEAVICSCCARDLPAATRGVRGAVAEWLAASQKSSKLREPLGS
jgi:hypothetical protein